MDILIVVLVAFSVAMLTFFSGFGLGTLLLPAFALFFPVEAAVAATAIVHLLNNIFKLILVVKDVNVKILLKFAVPAAILAALGAFLLGFISGLQEITEYSLGGETYQVEVVKVIIGILMIIFAFFELSPKLKNLQFDNKYIPLGGALSGFFGGLSGHQGALRTAFLIRAGLEKKPFIGTMVASAVIVDISRLIIYGITFVSADIEILGEQGSLNLIYAATGAAFAGSLLGRYLLEKITMKFIHLVVGIMLVLLGAGLILGMV